MSMPLIVSSERCSFIEMEPQPTSILGVTSPSDINAVSMVAKLARRTEKTLRLGRIRELRRASPRSFLRHPCNGVQRQGRKGGHTWRVTE